MKKIAGILILAALITSCYNDNKEELYPGTGGPCDTANMSFAADIQPIFMANCAESGCHLTGAATGGYTLDNYQGAKDAVRANRLLGAINHVSGFSAMPKGRTKLSDCEISKIEAWVNAGAQDN